MKILIDIGHPAHVHYFKVLATDLLAKRHEIFFTTRDKEFTINLLNKYNFVFKSIGKPYKGSIKKLVGLILFNYKIFKIALKFKPDLFLSAGSPYAAIVSSLMGKPHITLEDTFNFEQIRIYLLFTSVVLTGDYEHPSLGKKEIRYNGYQELAYLHPNYFTPDKSVLDELGLRDNDKYVMLRFVSWQATHDKGHFGISLENKIRAVKEFEKFAKVFISSEAELPAELKKYQLKIAPHKMHDVLSYCSLLFGESGTMSVENAILGNPSVFISNKVHSLQKDISEKYDLLFFFLDSYNDQDQAIVKGVEILTTSNIKEEWQKRREKMLADKIDVTAFLVWFVENYPESVRVMKENPDYQYKFK